MVTRILLAAYAVVGIANVVGEALGSSIVPTVTKPLLVPLLLAWLVLSARPGLATPLRWLSAGLVFAWLGDVLLMGDGDGFFIGGIAGFLGMQVCYLVAFLRVPGPGLVRAWKIALVPYAAIWVGVNALVSSGVGALRIPVLLYSAVLIAMAVAALDLVLRVPRPLGWRVAWGALLFVLSDALIAMTAFGPLSESDAVSAVIMATYVTAQAMIVTGFTGSVLATEAHRPEASATR